MFNLLTLFSGIGAPEKALDRLGIEYNLVNYCEIDKYASKSYSVIHGVPESKNLGDITKVDAESLPKNIDLCFYGFPCQDISLAGKTRGLFNEDGSLTRSGLFFEALRIIKATQPKVAIAENVKNLVSKKFAEQFKIVLDSLEEAGYVNRWVVMNAKNYGVPQNRERVFIVSIRKDIDNGQFKFPEGFPLKLRLRDLLEKTVDEKYYLSDCKIAKIETSHFAQEAAMIQHGDVCDTLLARDYKDPKCVEVEEPERMFGIFDSKETDADGNEIVHKHQAGAVWNADKVAPTLDTMQGGYRQPMVIVGNDGEKVTIAEKTKKGYAEARPGDSINLAFPNDTNHRGRVGCQVSSTLTANCAVHVVEEPKPIKVGNTTPSGKSQCNDVYDPDGIYPTSCAGQHGNANPSIVDSERFKKQAIETFENNECEAGDTIDAFNMRVNKSGLCPTLTTRPEGFKTAVVPVVESVPLKRGYSVEITEENQLSLDDIDVIGNYSKSDYNATQIVGKNGIAPTIRENHGQVTAIVDDTYAGREPRIYTEAAPAIRSERSGFKVVEQVAYDEQNDYIRTDDCVGTLTTDGSSPKHNNRIIEAVQYVNGDVAHSVRCGGHGSTDRHSWDMVAVEEPILLGGIGEKKSNGGTQYYQQNRVYDANGIAMCHPAQMPGGSYKYAVEEYVSDKAVNYIVDPKRGMATDINPDVVQPLTAKGQQNWTGSFVSPDIDHLEKSSTLGSTEPTKIVLKNGETITSDDKQVVSTLRIRKLTPRECFRLMDFDDEDFDKAAKVNSNTQLYKQAGNSIVVACPYYIIKALFDADIFKNDKEKEQKEMELLVKNYQLPEAIEFNFDEIKNELAARTEQYKVAVYTDDQIADAKRDKANLNKLDKALNDERIRMQREYMAPFDEFKAKIDELRAIIKEPVALIDARVKDFEDGKKRAKRDAIYEKWTKVEHDADLKLEQFFEERWLNASVSMIEVERNLVDMAVKYNDDVNVLKGLPEFSMEALTVYRKTLDMTEALLEVNRLADYKRKREEMEQKRKEEEARLLAEAEAKAAEQKPTPVPAENPGIVERKWIPFWVYVTAEQAHELSVFMKQNGIPFEAIRGLKHE